MKTSDKTSQVFRFDTVFKHYWLLRSGRLCFVAEVGVLGTTLRQSAGKWVSSSNVDKSRTAIANTGLKLTTYTLLVLIGFRTLF